MVAVCSGANMSFERLQFIAERTLLGSGREALFSVTLREQPRALLQFCQQIVDGSVITQFGYRMQGRTDATIFIGISANNRRDRQRFGQRLRKIGYQHTDLSDDNLAKEHIRHMIGGPAPTAYHEHFYEITFPERPSALYDFLKAVSNRWNISLFHYRGQGADQGSVLIGFEAIDQQTLEQSLTASGYEWSPVDSAASLQIFIR
jgi:threonine dehydratase